MKMKINTITCWKCVVMLASVLGMAKLLMA
jgi:hypothetical protein